MTHSMLPPMSSDMVPSYGLLKGYDWIDDFLELNEVLKALQPLRAKRKELEKIPSTKTDFKKRLKSSFDDYQERRRLKLQSFLKKIERSNNPFSWFERNDRLSDIHGRSISWDEVEEALKDLKLDGISDKNRAVQLDELDVEIKVLEEDVEDLSHPKFFPFVDGSVKGDVRPEFCHFWRTVQGRCGKPCNPQGLDLSQSSHEEKVAYERLGIAKSIKIDSLIDPYVVRNL